MLPSLHQPFESLAVRWQQRSSNAAGSPLASRNNTIGSPRSVKGFGPSLRCSIGISAYQKRRSTGCLVFSMTFLREFSRCQSRDDTRGIRFQFLQVKTWNDSVFNDDATADQKMANLRRASAG